MNTMNIITQYSTDVDLQWVASAAMKYSVLVYVPNLIGKCYKICVLCAIQRDRSALFNIYRRFSDSRFNLQKCA